MSTLNPTSSDSVKAVLSSNNGKKGTGGKWALYVLIAAALAGGAYYWTSLSSQGASAVTFKTTAAKTGSLSVAVTATGNLQPKNEVDVGSELSGTVSDVLVQENDQVKKGQVLAKLNTTQLKDTITKSKAALSSAQADVNKSAAAIVQAEATVKEAQTNLNRLQALYEASGGKLPAKTDLDSAQATLARAKADVASSKAAKLASEASVVQAKASLNSDETNFTKAIITSPIDGVVLSREIEPGQTVAASLSAPTLFTLAEDLSKMEVEVGVDEADVGQVKEGQTADFTVDAWPGRKYSAAVTRVSLGSTTSDNVVSYVTLLSVNNDDLTLRPGMTATATIKTNARDNVLLVPNAALRFTPPMPAGGEPPAPPDEAAAGSSASGSSSGGLLSKLMPRPPMMQQQKKRTTNTDAAASATTNSEQKVWVLENNMPRPVEVKTGITDGKLTEIVSGDLQSGMQVITESSGGTVQ